MITEEVRSYEVSLWTLQDEFITVLKWSDVEQQGRIRDPQMKINVDGTLELTFSIPMYLYTLVEEEGKEARLEKKENPIWYNTLNGNLIVGLRKVKVIFNKGEYLLSEASKHIFEFIITRITESHEQDLLICNITCEGLAFHELGKIGYKLSLSQDTYILDKEDWDTTGSWTKYDGTTSNIEPIENVQYWCEQCGLIPAPLNSALMDANKWYYEILMNWDSFSKVGNALRSSDKVYEDEYVSSWSDNLVPLTIESAREKARPISVSESNIYNITQTIAETFKIYCRYEYGYDDNYHIISRKVIFYNNYLLENDVISFTYPYTSSQITRDMDVTDLVTKMYVRPQDDTSVVSGQINIADCPSNRSKEDYLLNFDYLYQIGAITKELYDEIPVFEKNVRQLNSTLEDLSLLINALDNTIIEQSALEKIYDEARTLDQERIDYNSALYKELGAENGFLIRGAANPYSTYVKTNTGGGRYITLSDENKGVDPGYIMIFRGYNSAKLTFKNYIQPSNYTFEYDNGFVSKINFSSFSDTFTTDVDDITVNTDNWSRSNNTTSDTAISKDSALVYLVYKYKPKLYYDTVNLMWMTKKKNDEDAYTAAKDAHETAKANKVTAEANYKTVLSNKKNLIKKFELLMGPALREGYWQPEDYQDYGDKHHISNLTISSTYNSNTMIDDTAKSAVVGWDLTLFNDEDKLYYEESVLRTEVKYPCIILNSTLLSKISTWLSLDKKISFIFNNNYYRTLTLKEAAEVQNLSMFALGGDMHLGFVKGSSSTITPVLVLTGTQSMTNDLIKFMVSSGNARLGIVDILLDNLNKPYINVSSDAASLTTANFLWDTSIVGGVSNNSDYSIIYPRIKLSSNELNTSSIILKYNNVLLENYTDYSILSRIVTRNDRAYFEYFITIKPHVFFKAGTYTGTFDITYTLSNAATCIYLDAMGVMSDSSKPRASYTIDVNILDINYLSHLYTKLAQIVMINDTELKFENVFGYISELVLKLDAPWEDEIEIKNYKTKFEDLFSTIVALSEEMRKNGNSFLAAAAGEVPLTSEAFANTLTQEQIMLLAYLDSHFDSSEVVKAKLADIFTEAGAILASANNSLDELRNLNIKNAAILNGFVENVAADLTPNVVTSMTLPTTYKVGDVWNETDEQGNIIGRYIATSSSEGAAGGYTRTFDGTLAAIKGANMTYDAVAGTVDIYGEHKIDLKSGKHIYIAAGDSVDIVGNRAVNIGGATINIAAGDSSDLNGGYTTGGINLVSDNINFNQSNASIEAAIAAAINSDNGLLSKVLIHPEKIEMGGANIIMKGANKILMITSRNTLTSTSALSISPSEGVWIGSGQGIKLYAGNITVTYNNDGTFTPVSGTGASVELLPTHLLMGVSNTTSSGNVIEINDTYMVVASGDLTRSNDIGINSSGSLTGMKLTKTSFGLAIGSGTTRAVILADSNGITVGTGTTPKTSGSYVTISGSGIDIGSLGNLYVNMNNFKLQTDSTDGTRFAVGYNLQYITTNNLANGTIANSAPALGDSNKPWIGLVFTNNNLYVLGTVYASAGSFTGDVTANKFIATCTNGKFKADGNSLGFYTTSNAAIMTFNSTTSTMTVAGGYNLSISGNLDISATNLLINSNPTSGLAYLRLGDSANPDLQYTSSGLSIKGAITATSFNLASGVTIPYTSISGAPNPSSYSTNGIGWEQWPSSSGNYYVSLTSTADNQNVKGILIGVSESSNVTLHLIVPYSASSNTTIVDISKNGIKFDAGEAWKGWDTTNYTLSGGWNHDSTGWWYELPTSYSSSYVTTQLNAGNTYRYPYSTWGYINNDWYYFDSSGYMYTGTHIIDNETYNFGTTGALLNNHIYLDSNGIDVQGNRININGKEVWARDDIVVLTPALAASPSDISTVESNMAAAQTAGTIDDWIMIVPAYNVTLNFSLVEGSGDEGWTKAGTGGGTATLTMSQDLTLNYFITPQLAGVDYFDYEISFRTALPSSSPSREGGYDSAHFICTLVWNGSDGSTVKIPVCTSNINNSGNGTLSTYSTNYSYDGNIYYEYSINLRYGSYTYYNSAITLKFSSSLNVCGKDGILSLEVRLTNSLTSSTGRNMYVKYTTIVAKLKDTRNSSVPCAVYYYPKP